MNKHCWSNYTTLKQYKELYQEEPTLDKFINGLLPISSAIVLLISLYILTIIFLSFGG